MLMQWMRRLGASGRLEVGGECGRYADAPGLLAFNALLGGWLGGLVDLPQLSLN